MTTITCDYGNTITVDTDESSTKSGGIFITVSAYGAEHNVFLNAKKAVKLRDALVALAPFAALAPPRPRSARTARKSTRATASMSGKRLPA